jgi:hypothetical protein
MVLFSITSILKELSDKIVNIPTAKWVLRVTEGFVQHGAIKDKTQTKSMIKNWQKRLFKP